ncbi:MAG: TonB-dependent receptor plug domain-containing protein [Gammaproteobacteria bacterium]|nr:TonB-dependent receptor plug domain-containing protein [Gammaproteobacteria bacterium]
MLRSQDASGWPILAGLLLLGGAGSPATAQEGEESAGQIEEILVTAERRAQNLQETAIAITALSADTIEQTGVDQMEELQFVVPSLTYGMQSTYSLVAIRGVGSDVVTTAEPSIATYEDGVYTGLSFNHNVPGFDLERIEVLRGPQGTLYGRNAVGGVVNFISKQPSFEPEANVVATVGNLG